MSKKILFGDYETRSTVDLKKCGADVYARHSSTSVMAFGWAFGDSEVKVTKLFECPPQEVVEHVNSGGIFAAHNAPFEWLIWNYVWRRDFPYLPQLKIEQMECTMARSYAMGLPGSLEKASAALGIDDQKDLKGGRIMLQLSSPRDVKVNGEVIWWDEIEFSEKYDRMYCYCAQDITVEREIYKRTLPLSESEKEMWQIDHRINQRGVRVDIPNAVQASQIVAFEAQRLNEEIRKVTNNAVATTSSNAQLTHWLRDQGIPVDGVAKSDITILLEREDLPDDCARAIQIRRDAAKSSTAKIQALLLRAGKDQILRSTLQYHGAGTGRWAGRGYQIHNLPRPKLTQADIEGVFDVLEG